MKKKIKSLIWRFFAKYFPIYIDLPHHYQLAMWSEDGDFKSLRITIRIGDGEVKGYQWLFTIKKGNHRDPIRCSKHFRPFGINLQRFFKARAV